MQTLSKRVWACFHGAKLCQKLGGGIDIVVEICRISQNQFEAPQEVHQFGNCAAIRRVATQFDLPWKHALCRVEQLCNWDRVRKEQTVASRLSFAACGRSMASGLGARRCLARGSAGSRHAPVVPARMMQSGLSPVRSAAALLTRPMSRPGCSTLSGKMLEYGWLRQNPHQRVLDATVIKASPCLGAAKTLPLASMHQAV